MKTRPVSVIVIACLYVATGVIGSASHFMEFRPGQPFQYDIVWASLVNLVAVIAGVYMLRGNDWARWLALAWIAFHVVLSIFHSPRELALHSLFLIAFTYLLFRPEANRYFRTART
jgi:hypothetical protein